MHIDYSMATRGSETRSDGGNQDAVLVALGEADDGKARVGRIIACVADGMSRFPNASRASQHVVGAVVQPVLSSATTDLEGLRAAMIRANDCLLAPCFCEEVGSTATIVVGLPDRFYIAHIGDCRVYFIRERAVEIVTRDHTLLADKLGVHAPARHLVRDDNSAKVLTRSLGEGVLQMADVFAVGPVQTQPGDILLLCSDGVWTEFDDSELVELTMTNPTPMLADRIVSLAMSRDPSDDATVVAIRF